MSRLLLALAALCPLLLGSDPARAADLSIVCGRDARETLLCRGAAADWAARTGNQVRVFAAPPDAARRLNRYQELLGVGAAEPDVLEIDALWCGVLAPHLADLRPLAGGAESDFLPALIGNATAHGRLVALPWYLELGLLYYRSDLLARYRLPVPRTWAELADTAQRLQESQRLLGNPGFWGLLWAGGEDEALTTAALEWIAGQGGGTLIAPDGRITLDNPRARFALQRAADWIGAIAPRVVLRTSPGDTLDAFRTGQAAFLRHWSGAWETLRHSDTPVAERFEISHLPAGNGAAISTGATGAGTTPGPAAALGGGQLAVSRYSAHPREAADLVLSLTGAAVQHQRLLAGGFLPTRAESYADPELRAAVPRLADVATALPGLVARPSTPTAGQYPEVSAVIAAAVRTVLTGEQTPEAALTGLARRLGDLSQNGTAW